MEYRAALGGEQSAIQWYYEKIDSDVLEIATPVMLDGEIQGVVAVGLSLKNIHTSLFWKGIAFSIISIFLFFMFCWVQRINVVQPITKLDKQISNLDGNYASNNRLIVPPDDTFEGLYTTINSLLGRIEHAAYHDHLTDLPNRRVLMERLKIELENQQHGAVMMLDLDNFKDINDTFGHIYGDQVLVNVSNIFKKLITKDIYIYRVGGDEFLILITKLDNIDITAFVNTIFDQFDNHSISDKDEIYIKFSIGISKYPQDSNDANNLIAFADMAMYNAKTESKNSFNFYNNVMALRLQEKNQIKQCLQNALLEDNFELFYQPKVTFDILDISGFEGLLRFKNNSISPDKFIPIAEETGSIIEISRWVTREAVYQMKMWNDMGLEPKSVSINFSAKQLYDTGYVQFLYNLICEANIDPTYIEIEITENLLIENEEEIISFLNQLKQIGVKILLDDFGKAYSSLNYLTYLPIDMIKLDKSLCDKYKDPTSRKVINAIINLANSLNLQVVAEGIETKEQCKWFKDTGCNYAQGYFFSKPLKVNEVEKIYNRNFSDLL
ncbi:diguanylate cyclase (GGDEF)-like protein [Desulfitispora alkaliphila]|uniref:putative bifunctional diguanylate cyclase/phosphodiesterase n=1 Tax=Desulfitispora alkaliphila TaxID=622674 RepID=UPI003D1ABCE7